MATRTGSFLLIALIGLAAWCAGGIAGAAEPAATALTLLEIGWEPSIASFEAACGQYGKLRTAAAGDLRASYAMALVAIHHHKGREAAQFIDESLATKPNNLHLRQVRLWIRVWNKDYKTALPEISAIGKDMAAAASAGKLSDEQMGQQSRRLGVLIGFLRGPAAGRPTDDQVSAVEKALRESLPRWTHGEITAGQESVDATQRQIAEELHAARIKAKSTNDEKGAIDIESLNKLRESLKEQTAQVGPRYEPQINQLTAEVRHLKATNVQRYEKDRDGKPDKTTTKGSNDERIKERESFLNELRMNYRAELARLQKQDSNAAKRITRLKQQAQRELADDGHSMTVRKRMAALTTYCEFPLDQEREKLVASFNNK